MSTQPNTTIMRQRLADILTEAHSKVPHARIDICHLVNMQKCFIHLALDHGHVDAIDLIYICRALDLDASAVLADVANYQPEAIKSQISNHHE